jgi:hypothetical protein
MAKKPKVPYPEDQYFIDEDEKVIWLMGSWIRSMALKNRRETLVPGYTIKLCQYEYVQGLKANENTRKK